MPKTRKAPDFLAERGVMACYPWPAKFCQSVVVARVPGRFFHLLFSIVLRDAHAGCYCT
jgi:hypothetical protein